MENINIIETEYTSGKRVIGYTIDEVGYSIYLDDNLWIKQTTYIPYKADTIEESVLLHIQEVADKDEEEQTDIINNLIDEVIMLKECILELSEVVYE